MGAVTPAKFLRPLAITGALAFVYFAVLVKLGRDWWTDENYSHGLLVPLVIGYIIWCERKRLSDAPKAPAAWLGLTGAIISLAMLWAGVTGAELFLQRISIVMMLASVVIYFWGPRLLSLLVVPAALLVFSIPIPTIVFNKIAFPLQLFASRCAVATMSFLSIPALRQGNVIELMPLGASAPKKLAVVEACSGIRSLMTLVTLALVYAYFTKPASDGKNSNKIYAHVRSLILVAAAIPIAVLTNAFRVSGTGVLARYYGTKIADGFFHTFSGWVIYILAALLLFVTGWILDRVMRLGKAGASPRNPGGPSAPSPIENRPQMGTVGGQPALKGSIG